MYVEIKENKLLSWCENPYKNYVYIDIDYSTFNPDEYIVENGMLIKDLNNAVYVEKQREFNQLALQNQIDELDKKRIRAIAEPALKDEQSGQTWLEYYTEQIVALRTQMVEFG